MADVAHMKQIQEEIKRDVQEQLKKIVDALDIRERDYAARFTEIEDNNEDRLSRIETAVESLLQRAVESQHDALNSSKPQTRPPFQMRNVKLEFPRFDGTHAIEWIFKAEQFFEYYATPDADRLTIAAVHLDQKVVPWYQMMQRTNPFQSWQIFARAIEVDFGPSVYECPRATLFKLTQKNTVNEYYMEFTSLANRVYGLSIEAMLDCFVSGLNPELQREVIAHTPPSIQRAVALAKLFEEKCKPTKTYPTTNNPKTFPINNPNPNRSNQPPLLPTPASKPTSNYQKNQSIRKISSAEMQLRREKGLCYTCEDKWSFNHKCPNKHIMLLQVDEEEIVEQTPDHNDQNNPEPIQQELELHLSLNALKGASGVGTIKFVGHIGNTPVQILVDGGSSDNFLQPRIAQFLKLDVEPAPCFKVLVGNGNSLSSEGTIKELKVSVQGHELKLPVYLLPIVGADLILGATWLATLGPHVADYKALTIKFFQQGNFITLQGEKCNSPQQAQLHHMRRLQVTEAIAEYFTVQREDPYRPQDNWLELPQNIDPELALLLNNYKEVFKQPAGLPPQRLQDHKIPLEAGSQPVKVRPYRYPQSQKEQIEIMVKEMLTEGIIQPSTSPFSSPIVLVKKKDGTWRFCTDYRALNAITVKDSFPIPTVDELLDELFGAQYFSKLDLRSGYHQILVHPEDRFKTAFRTHQGHYQWLVMPFGLSNAPASFQSLMNQIFQPFLRKFVLVFFDDILVYSPSFSAHLKHLETVLQTLQTHTLFVKLSKCSFGSQEVDYLGHTVSGSGVAMDKSKIQSVLDWPVPGNLKQLRGFLGLTGYYRRFIKSYAQIATSLTDLLKKDSFVWNSNAEVAFAQLKQAITSAPVLALPQFELPFTLETDASGTGIGAVLSQNNHPIAFFSKKLGPRMQKQSAYTREFFAITEAIAKFRHYLLGHKFTIRTDQKSLKSLTSQALQTPEQQAWLHKLLGYDFTIEYKPGKENIAADALSRVMIMAWSQPNNLFLQELREACVIDEELQNLKRQHATKPDAESKLTVRDEMIFWKDRLVVPDNTIIREKILQEFHNSAIGGHAGIARTMARVTAQFYWKNMKKDITQFVQNCAICQQAKHETKNPAGLLQPLPIPQQIWEDISMDFITGLPNSFGYTVIMVVVDRLSKYSHFLPLKTDYSSKSVAETFMKNVVKHHGIPKSIVSDRDKVFMSKFWKDLFQLQGTTLAMSSAYHPQSDGQSEAVNKCLKMYLRCLISQNPRIWVKVLDWAQYWYNTSFHTSLGMTPFKLVYGRDPPTLLRQADSVGGETLAQTQLHERDMILAQAKANLRKSQQYMKAQADKHRHDVQFQVGDNVLVKLQPYRQHSVALRKNQKLGMRYFGPFTVMSRIGAVAYKLQLPPEAKIHSVFHVSQLKLFKGNCSQPYIPLPITTHEMGPVLQPTAILKARNIRQGQQIIPQVLVQWEQLSEDEATWEDYDEIKKQFPNSNLEDKIEIKGGGIVREPMKEGQVSTREKEAREVARQGKRTRTPNIRLRDFI